MKGTRSAATADPPAAEAPWVATPSTAAAASSHELVDNHINGLPGSEAQHLVGEASTGSDAVDVDGGGKGGEGGSTEAGM
mmetsp:Transcript_75241/g.190855  ORF Transcript_75241/g.190855 Transcript_75241/m.190855 type:complete len:80 (-) Transcript_75241:149-388(-)